MVKCRYLIVLLSLSLCGCASLLTNVPNPIVQEKDMIYEVRKGTALDLWYSGEKKSVTLNESRFLVTEDFLVEQATAHTMEILNKVKAKQDKKVLFTIIGSILALLGGITGIIFSGKMKSLIPKKITVEAK